MPKPHTLSDDQQEISSLTMAGNQLMLDALRAEISALQAMLPGLARADAPLASEDSADAVFDNMPV